MKRFLSVVTSLLMLSFIAGCSGQVQVINDLLGSYTDFVPRHAKQYAKLADIISGALTDYYNEVRAGEFPTRKQSSSIDEGVLAGLKTS